VAELWAGRPRGAVAMDLLEKRVALDSGTVLVAETAGIARLVLVVYPSTDVLAGQSMISPFAAEGPIADHYPIAAAFVKAVVQWMVAVGYTATSAAFPDWMWDHPATNKGRLEWTERSRRTDPVTGEIFVMVESPPLAALLARQDSAWEAL
jgi:hypothetical protein